MNLLIVDDEYFSVEGIRTSCDWHSMGFKKVLCGYSLSQAQQIFKAENIDIMIADIEMPKGSGIELLQWVSDQNYKCITIFLTSHAKYEYASMALKLGAIDYLLKPVDKAQLLCGIQKAIHKKHEESQLLDIIMKNDIHTKESNQAHTQINSPVELVKQYIMDHLDEELNREALAAMAFLSPDHLSHLFKQKNGESLSAYIIRKRLEKSRILLLNQQLRISDVAMQCGFSNTAYFSKIFYKETGQTPRDFRNQYRW